MILNSYKNDLISMKPKKYTIASFLFLLLTPLFQFYLYGQPLLTNEIINDPNIKTILLYKTGNDLSFPIIKLNGEETLRLDFDYLDEQGANYSYSMINCTYNWKINNISENQYMDGFNDVQINDFRSSRNTTRLYTHYSAIIPDEKLRILSSGNYLLNVYKNGEPDKVAFTRKLCISEDLVEMNTKTMMPDQENQEIQLEIDLKNLDLINPLSEIKVVVIKNYDWNHPVKIKSSPILRDKKLYFDLPYQIESSGGNEFRTIDIKNVRYESERIGYIEFIQPYYHVHLKPDKLKQFTPYFSSRDFNSHYYIDKDKAFNRHEEADYVYVYFTLESDQPFGSDVYIYGALTGYKTDTSNYMQYNPERRVYEKTLMLKQGFYDYAYLTKDYNKDEIDLDLTEGNHAETENDYLILVYLCQPMNDIDRLIGFKAINSLIK